LVNIEKERKKLLSLVEMLTRRWVFPDVSPERRFLYKWNSGLHNLTRLMFLEFRGSDVELSIKYMSGHVKKLKK
jgi:hypothetical protein